MEMTKGEGMTLWRSTPPIDGAWRRRGAVREEKREAEWRGGRRCEIEVGDFSRRAGITTQARDGNISWVKCLRIFLTWMLHKCTTLDVNAIFLPRFLQCSCRLHHLSIADLSTLLVWKEHICSYIMKLEIPATNSQSRMVHAEGEFGAISKKNAQQYIFEVDEASIPLQPWPTKLRTHHQWQRKPIKRYFVSASEDLKSCVVVDKDWRHSLSWLMRGTYLSLGLRRTMCRSSSSPMRSPRPRHIRQLACQHPPRIRNILKMTTGMARTGPQAS